MTATTFKKAKETLTSVEVTGVASTVLIGTRFYSWPFDESWFIHGSEFGDGTITFYCVPREYVEEYGK